MINGCLAYTEAMVKIYFTGRADCEHCPLLETYARRQCRRTGEYLYKEQIRGEFCPLEIEVEANAEDGM